jgi:hypothetical protein
MCLIIFVQYVLQKKKEEEEDTSKELMTEIRFKTFTKNSNF